MSKLIFLIAILLSSSSFAKTSQLKLSDLLREARFASKTTDHYKAVRLFRWIQNSSPSVLAQEGLADYFKSLQIVGSDENILELCKSLSTKVKAPQSDYVNYHCGKALLSSKYSQNSENYLNNIPKESKLYTYASVILSEIDIREKDATRCLKRFSNDKFEIFKKEKLLDLYYLTRGRCNITVGNYNEALRNYQKIREESLYYLDVLQEVGWLHFKSRNLERAIETLGVIVATYESTKANLATELTEADSLNAKYLRAYTDLLKKGVTQDSRKFNSLKKELLAYLDNEDTFTQQSFEELFKQVEKDNIKWLDIESVPLSVASLFSLVKTWGTATAYDRMIESVEFRMAVTREVQRVSKVSRLRGSLYERQVQRLDTIASANMKDGIFRGILDAKRNIRSLILKSEMGGLELNWIARNEGVRDTNQLIQAYQDDVRTIAEFLGEQK